MTNHPKKTQRIQRKIINAFSLFSSADSFWPSVFAFSSRAEVGLKFAQLSKHFDALTDKHLTVTECFLGILHIRRSEKGEGAEIVKFDEDGQKVLPIPQNELPDRVIGFRRLSIGFVDHSVLAFLRLIHRLIDNESKIMLDIRDSQKLLWALLARSLWPLLGPGMGTLDCLSGVRSSAGPSRLLLMRRHFAPSVLSNCAKLRLVECFGILPQAPPDERPSATVGQALCAWLHTPRLDGRPKLLKCVTEESKFAESVHQLKELFLRSSSPVNFVVRLSAFSACSPSPVASSSVADFTPFVLENGKTLERFTARLCRHSFWLLERAPIERNEQKWAQWEREVIGRKRWNTENGVIRVAIGTKDYGSICDRSLRSRTPKNK